MDQPLLRDWHEDDGGGGGGGGGGVGESAEAPRSRSVRELLRTPSRFFWIFLARCVALILTDMGAISCSIEYSRWSTTSSRTYTGWLALVLGFVAFALYCVQPYLGHRGRRIGPPLLVVFDFAALSALVTAAGVAFVDRGRFDSWYPHPELLATAILEVMAGVAQAIISLDTFTHLVASLASKTDGQIRLATA